MKQRLMILGAMLCGLMAVSAQPRYDFSKMNVERLDRGVVAVRNGQQVVVSWRQLMADKADEAWVEGVKLVYRKFTEELKKLGLTEIEAEGKFDPNLHNAVLSEAAEGVESETILAVLQKGYKMGDKILRHSMVKVSE